jgi:3-deoxy-D-manno-octulosonic-acid transferase
MPLVLDALYLLVLVALSPWLAWRAAVTGRYRRDLAAKLLGRVAVPNPDSKPVAWFHGVSVGEVHLLVTLVGAFRKRHPDWVVVVSSTTDTGLAEARVRFADCVVVPYQFDFSWAVGRALDTIKPRVVVLAESELWPNFLAAASRRRVPVVVVNGRLSPRSFSRLRQVAWIARRLLFRHVTHFAVQSDDYADRLRQLGVPSEKVSVTGSVKYDGATGDRDSPKAVELRRLLGLSGRELVWVAGSTHAPEEAVVLDAFARLRSRFPDLLLILVPRHPDRFAEVADLVAKSGLPHVRRGQLTRPVRTPPAVVLLDTVGELGAAWGLADVGYTGGSLDGKRGGQSMIEPAGYGVPTVFGPHVWNFRDAARRLVEAGGAVVVPDAAGLERAIGRLVGDTELRRRMGAAARELVKQQQGATARTLDLIDRVVAAGPAP